MNSLCNNLLPMMRSMIFGLVVMCCSSSQAALIIQWNISGPTGAAPLGASMTATNISNAQILRGSGLTSIDSDNQYRSRGWASTSPNDYVGLRFTIDPGYALQLDSLQLRSRVNNNGPASVGLFLGGINYGTVTHSNNTNVDTLFNLSGSGLLTGTVEFQLLQIGNLSPRGVASLDSGVYALRNYNGNSPITFNGTLSSIVPEPGTFIPVGLFCFCNLLWRNRLWKTEPHS